MRASGRTMLLAIVLCALLAAPVAWNARTSISPDGISYLEIAEKAVTLSPSYLLSNAYWSPAYPALIAVTEKVVHPALQSELSLVRGLDWIIFVGACLSFSYFLLNLLRWVDLAHGSVFDNGSRRMAFLIFAYTMFFVSNLDSSLWTVSPDVLLEGIVYLAAGVYVRLSLPGAGLRHYAGLGLALGIAYIAKAILFPLSLLLLLLLFMRPVDFKFRRKGVWVALTAFIVAASPFVAVLSQSRGHLTFGDSGRVNYARHVNGANFFSLWGGDSHGSGVPIHPTKKLASGPLIVKFDGAFEGTWWPFWYDQTYWYDGVEPHFNLHQQWIAYLGSLGLDPKGGHEGITVLDLAKRWIPLFGGLLFFVFVGLRIPQAFAALREHLWLLLWPTGAVLVYAGVVLHYRYVVSFVVLAWVSLFVASSIAKPARAARVMLLVALSLLLVNSPTFASPLVHMLLKSKAVPQSDAWSAAAAVEKLGIRRGDQLAGIGFPFRTYFARLAGASFTEIIVANPASLRKLPSAEVGRVLETLRVNGAKALVSLDRPAFDNDSGWRNVGQEIYIRLLR